MSRPEADPTKLNAARLQGLGMAFRGVRKQSDYVFLGLPLYSVAIGPDLAGGEARGHAKGVFAYGDVATGIIAIGGFARGGLAIGGFALGVVALGGFALGIAAVGGVAVGLLLAFGGAAIGGIAIGGGALGVVAIGGAAAGYYAAGGAAYGTHVLDAVHKDPEAIAFFSQWEFLQWLGPTPGRRR